MVGARFSRARLLTNVLVLLLAAPLVVPGVEAATVFSDDFNDGVIDATKWTTIGAVENADCGANSAPFALKFDGATRSATTVAMDVSGGGAVEFYLHIGIGSSPCENADSGEDVLLQFSTNGGSTWTTMATYAADSFGTFTSISETIPSGAQTSSTQFRWTQPSFSGTCCDHWVIDDVRIGGPFEPGAPRNLQAEAGPGVGEITLAWQVPAGDGGSSVTNYRVYRSTLSGGPYAQIAEVGNVLTYTDTGVPDDATRYYRVSAVNAVGEGPQSNTASATTFSVPNAPQNLEAQAGPGVGEITLTWQTPAFDGGTAVTNYRIHRSTLNGGPYAQIAQVGNVLTYTDTGRELGTTYYYVVSAVNAIGEGPHSNQADAPGTEPAGPPTGGTATRTLLALNDVTVTPSEPLPPEDVPGQTTPDYPGSGVVPTPDYPGTGPEPTPDYPGTGPVVTPDYPGTDPVPTDPTGEDVGTLSVQDNAAGEVCIDFTPEGGAAQNIACLNRAFLGPADGLVQRGDTTVFVADPPDVPGTSPQPTPDVPGTPSVAVPDVPGTPPQPVPDVPGTPPVAVPDVPPTPTGSLGDTPRTSIDVGVSYAYDTGRLSKAAGLLGDAVQAWSPVGPSEQDALWFATHGDDVPLCFSFVLYKDGIQQGSTGQCVPFLGQALAAAEATAGTLP